MIGFMIVVLIYRNYFLRLQIGGLRYTIAGKQKRRQQNFYWWKQARHGQSQTHQNQTSGLWHFFSRKKKHTGYRYAMPRCLNAMLMIILIAAHEP